MNLTIENLVSAGAFTGAPVKKEITLAGAEGEFKADVYVRRIGYAAAISDITSSVSKGDPVAGRIASSICDAEGKAVFAAGDVTGESDNERGPMSRELVMELLRVMGEVNGAGKKKS